MATPLALARAQLNLRLLELPAPLLLLLEAPAPPVLSIKSGPAADSPSVLCTHNQTYELRQVHTSNSVLIARPVDPADSPHGSPAPAISAIAQCGALLELLPVSASPVPLLRAAITRIWNSERWHGDTVAGFSGELVGQSKAGLFADMPFSDDECEQAWIELAAFEFDAHPVLPTPPALWMYWKAIFTTALAEGIDLGAQFKAHDLAKTLQEEEGLWPELVRAILRRLLPDDEFAANGWTVVDRAKCVPWVGRNLLVAIDSHYKAARPTSEFLDLWRDALPEAWRTDAVLEKIQGDYTLPSDHTIAPNGGPTLQQQAASGPAAKGPRKWHEKFKASRKQ